jgi:signal transduction histidine kinase
VAYYLGAHAGFALRFAPVTTSVLWPPNAILSAALLLTAPRRWWLYLLAALPAHLAVEVGEGLPLAMIVALFVTNCSEALIGATGVRLFGQWRPSLDTLSRTVAFIVAVGVVAPLVSSLADAAVVMGFRGEPYWTVWRTRLFANSLTALSLVPVILWIATRTPAALRRAVRARLAEAVLLGIALLASGLLVLGGHGVEVEVPGLPPTPTVFIMPVLLWAAVRFGPTGLAFSLLLCAWGVAHAALWGNHPFVMMSPVDSLIAIQVYLVVMSLPFFCLAALLAERRRAMADLTQRLRLEGLEVEAERMRRELGRFAHIATLAELGVSLAHQINQPLAAMLSNAQAAGRSLDGPRPDIATAREALAEIVEDDRRASHTIYRLREVLARTHDAAPAAIDVHAVVRDVATLMSSEAIIRNISVRCELAPGPALVLGHRIELQQVLLNLIVNAMESVADTPVDERSIVVSSDRLDSSTLLLTVSDRGEGLSPGSESRVFEPFFTTRPSGMGMGLSIVKSIVEAHGGRVWAQRGAVGAAFHVSLPLRATTS